MFVDPLTRYAAYHRDARNIATHLVGVSMIMFAVIILLSRPIFSDGNSILINPALFIASITAMYNVYLDRGVGALTALLLPRCCMPLRRSLYCLPRVG